METRLLPNEALKVVLSGLLDTTWGKDYRSTIVRFFVYGNRVRIGVGEGNIKKWEIDALKSSPIRHEWFKIDKLSTSSVPGIKYVPEKKKVWGLPKGLIPAKSKNVRIFVNDEECAIFPAYRCFDIDLGEGRILSIISPKTLVRDVVKTSHPTYPEEKYRGKIDNVEVKLESLRVFFNKGYGVGVLKKTGSWKIKSQAVGFPLLGSKDIEEILSKIEAKHSEPGGA